MAGETPVFLVFATNGEVRALTEAEYLQGFAYLGNMPPTVADFNYLFQLEDQKFLYLKNALENPTWPMITDYIKDQVTTGSHTCKLCGQPYTVQGGYQKYCPPCQVVENKRRSSESHKRLYPARREVLLKRARDWAITHPDRVTETLRKSYRRNLSEIVERRRKRGLKLRPLGRQELCPRCGQQFAVAERNQIYCDGCREHR